MTYKIKPFFKYFFLNILIIIGIFFNSTIAHSAEKPPLGFSVESVLPDSQIDKDKAYFYLKTEPGKNQEVKIKVTGSSEDPVKVKVYTANANTSEKGTIDYAEDVLQDPTLSNSIKEITEVDPPEFEIKKGEEQIVTVKISVPSEHYEGIKIGTIYFKQESEKKEKSTITSTYGYRIGLIISESDASYTDGKSLNLLSVTPELKRLQKTISITLQNPEPKIIEDFSMTASIIDEKTGKTLKKQKITDGRIAPNSQFNFGVDWGIDTVPAGTYIAKVSAQSRYESWELEKKFEITQEQSKKMNENTVYKLKLPSWAYIGLTILCIIIFVDVIYLSLRQRKWKKEVSKKKRKNNTKKKKGVNKKKR